MSLLIRKKTDAPVGKGLLENYLAQSGSAPDTSAVPGLMRGNPASAIEATPGSLSVILDSLTLVAFATDVDVLTLSVTLADATVVSTAKVETEEHKGFLIWEPYKRKKKKVLKYKAPRIPVVDKTPPGLSVTPEGLLVSEPVKKVKADEGPPLVKKRVAFAKLNCRLEPLSLQGEVFLDDGEEEMSLIFMALEE